MQGREENSTSQRKHIVENRNCQGFPRIPQIQQRRFTQKGLFVCEDLRCISICGNLRDMYFLFVYFLLTQDTSNRQACPLTPCQI